MSNESNDEYMTKEEHNSLMLKAYEGLSREESRQLTNELNKGGSQAFTDFVLAARKAVIQSTTQRKRESLQAQYQKEMDALLKKGASKHERLKLRDTWRSKGLDI